jgi:hypothetical protein
MTEEEKKKAIAIHQQREEEYRRFFEANPSHPKHPANFHNQEDVDMKTLEAILPATMVGLLSAEQQEQQQNNDYLSVSCNNQYDLEMQTSATITASTSSGTTTNQSSSFKDDELIVITNGSQRLETVSIVVDMEAASIKHPQL